MKNLFLLIAMCCLCSSCFAQSEIYKKFADIDGVETVYIPNIGGIMKLGGIKNTEIDEMEGLPINMSKMNKLEVLSSEKANVIAKMKKEFQPILNKIKGDKDYELLLENKSDDERTTIYINKTKGEMLIVNDEDDEFQIIMIFGDFNDTDSKSSKHKLNK